MRNKERELIDRNNDINNVKWEEKYQQYVRLNKPLKVCKYDTLFMRNRRMGKAKNKSHLLKIMEERQDKILSV